MFIVFEGLDGSGKTTQIEHLAERLRANGKIVELTAEPTDWIAGRLIRDVIEHRQTAHPQTVAALFAADRLEHLHRPQTGILARLQRGEIVIASRYYYSSLAYQAEFASLAWVASLNEKAKETKTADLTFFLDLPPEQSMARIQSSRTSIDLYETQQKLAKVRADFQAAFLYWPDENLHTLDASQPVEDLADTIYNIVQQKMLR